MIMQHATYVLKTCVAQAERMPRVLRQFVEDHRMLEVTAGVLHSRLAAASGNTATAGSANRKNDEGLLELAAFCEVGKGCHVPVNHHQVIIWNLCNDISDLLQCLSQLACMAAGKPTV